MHLAPDSRANKSKLPTPPKPHASGVYLCWMVRERSVTVVGAGIVGLAIARAFAERGFMVVVLEKESELATHQTGRNSGVIHAGPYYKPGSLKAQLCVSGGRSLKNYAKARDIHFTVPGKLIVATESAHVQRIDDIHKRAQENGVTTELVQGRRIREIEPNCVAQYGIHVKETGVIDYSAVAQSFAQDLQALGGSVKLNSPVISVTNVGSRVAVSHGTGEELSDYFVNAAGLQSDRIALLSGVEPEVRIVPFKGQYFDIKASKASLVQGLVYPAPDPEMPFLGVHITKSLDESLHAGPNAILALGREAYSNWKIDTRDLSEVLVSPGFWRFVSANRAFALKEGLRMASKKAFVRELSKLIQGIEVDDLKPSESGIRAQAMTSKGQLVDDFVVERNGNQMHILNAPSPAATACMAIADWVVNSSLASD